MARYVEVSRDAMVAAMAKAGFAVVPNGNSRGAELVYARRHDKDKKVSIKIFTSMPADRSMARGCGEDAIRVVAVFDDGNGKNFPVCKLPRVHRTGSEEAVIERTLERARDAWRFVSLWTRTPYAQRKHLPRPGEKDEAREERVARSAQRQAERTPAPRPETRRTARHTHDESTYGEDREPGSDDDYTAGEYYGAHGGD